MTKMVLLNVCPKCRCSCVPIKGESITTETGRENFRITFKCMNNECGFITDETFEDVDKNFKKVMVNSSPIILDQKVIDGEESVDIHYELSDENIFDSPDKYELIKQLIGSGLLRLEFNNLKKDEGVFVKGVIDKYNDQITAIITTLRELQDRINSNDIIERGVNDNVTNYNPIPF